MRKIVNMVQMSEEEFKAWHESKKEIKKLKGYLDDAQKVGARLMTENVILASEVEGLRSENQVLKNQLKLSDKKYSETIRELICENDKIRSDSDSVADSMLEMSVENEKLKATISNMEEANNILRKNLEDILTENERICRNKCCKDQEDEIKKLKHLIASEDAHIDFSSEASTGVTVIIIK